VKQTAARTVQIANQPNFGRSPDVRPCFIPLAEYTGQIRAITPWVINEALRQSVLWRARGLDWRVAVNVSARDLIDTRLPTMVGELVAEHNAQPQWLTLEITESGIMADPISAQQVIEALHAMGFDLAIDDFGTGYSSLSYLKQLAAKTLKIDRSFVDGCAEASEDAQIVGAIVGLAHNLGMQVVAEGIETSEQVSALQRMRCDAAQGYLIAKPLAGAAMEDFLNAHSLTEKRVAVLFN